MIYYIQKIKTKQEGETKMGLKDTILNKVEQTKKEIDKYKFGLDEQLNEIVLGIISIYKAQEVIAKKLGVELPKPLVKMEIEED